MPSLVSQGYEQQLEAFHWCFKAKAIHRYGTVHAPRRKRMLSNLRTFSKLRVSHNVRGTDCPRQSPCAHVRREPLQSGLSQKAGGNVAVCIASVRVSTLSSEFAKMYTLPLLRKV